MRFIRCAVLAGLPFGLLLTDGLTPTTAHAEPGDAKAFYIGKQPQPRSIAKRAHHVRVPHGARLAALGDVRLSVQPEARASVVQAEALASVHPEPRSVAGDPRPSTWCGWWLRRRLGVADRTYNLASAWARYGKPAPGPAPGVIAVWHHHVGLVTGVPGPGRIMMISGNDDHAVRERERPSRGVIAWRMP